MTKVWAHRGASAYAPENTIPAFELAAKMGADGVELDVRLSRDGKLVVLHDPTVDRTSDGKGRVSALTIRELKALDFSGGRADYAGARIPTLKEVYGLLRPTSLTVNVEIKFDPPQLDACRTLLALQSEMGMAGRVLYSSFDHYMLRALRRLDPAAPVGLLYAQPLCDPWVYASHLRAGALHPDFHDVLDYPEIVSGCAAANVEINAWTADEEADIRALFAANINAVITNAPDVALRCRDAR